MANKGSDGVERGGAGADAGAVGVGDGDGRGGGREAAEGAYALELAVVERGLLGAGSREHDGVPGRHARRVARGQSQPAPRLSQRRCRLLRRARPPPSRARVHRRRLPRLGPPDSDQAAAGLSVDSLLPEHRSLSSTGALTGYQLGSWCQAPKPSILSQFRDTVS